ncbi:hypothetical protein GCM10010168_62230 [Actinoplanes ianthinogenes]|uniref:ABC transporter permease n=1 Tax=Actinoplanes ianthinogenes TaxID=122358 RepID=A0ABM7LJT6_9ACTN|nr:ABC transporter permease [Actinoplanes ianthinogenes]BCJ39529.1 hypothetical protein Aiant_01860 [Actinoplanes ianthinogenes]GGR35476.1 hypothetical protein GCM10010168_62230 [Actinoplanes ianthinogenes]
MVLTIRAELRKLLGLPTARVGLILGVLIAPLLVLINAPATRESIADGTLGDPTDLGFRNLGIGLLGALILGVVSVSSEYTPTGDDSPGARQLTATLTAVPHRLRLLIAKATALVLVVAVQGLITATATLALTELVHGDAVPAPSVARVAGAILYWVLITLLAFAITLIARNGVITLTVLILNSSVVSVSYLLYKVMPLAAYLPDIVGPHMFIRSMDLSLRIPPVTAGLVMTAWVAAFLILAAWLFQRRDP